MMDDSLCTNIDWRTAFVLLIYLCLSTMYGSAQNCREISLGIQNSVIPADKITASSGAAGDQARLNYTDGPAWCAMGNDVNPYLQIDLGTPHIICAVSTQGDHQVEEWVRTFKLNYSDDGNTYNLYIENGNTQQLFYGNVDGSGIVKQILYQGITARYLRILPMMHRGAVCMRAEIYGIQIQKALTINYAYQKSATQSSVSWGGEAGRAVDGNRDPNYFHNSCSHTSSEWEPWWMVDLGQRVSVFKVYIVNRGFISINRLHNFQIHIGENKQNGGSSNPKCGDSYTIPIGQSRSIFCAPSMMGRYVTVKLNGLTGSLSLCEVEIYTEDKLGLAIGVSNSSSVPDNGLTASSVYSNTRSAAKARLFGDSSWRPRDDDRNPWLQVDLQKIYYVCAVATQGDPKSDERTTKYEVKGSERNDSQWTTMEWKDLVLTGNTETSKVSKHVLSSPLSARMIRFYPLEKNKAHALRVEIYAVPKEPGLSSLSQIGDKLLKASHGSHVDLVCRAEGGLSIKWYHNDTDITSYSIGTLRTGSTLISKLRVNYTSADDIFKKYSYDEAKGYCTSLDYICQVDYGSYRKLQSRGRVLVKLVGRLVVSGD